MSARMDTCRQPRATFEILGLGQIERDDEEHLCYSSMIGSSKRWASLLVRTSHTAAVKSGLAESRESRL